MAARTYSRAVKTQVTDDAIIWRLEFSPARDLRPLPLQKWRVVGDGRTTKEQIIEYATTFQASHSEEGENTVARASRPDSAPSSSLTMADETCMDGQNGCLSPSTRHSFSAEAETLLAQSSALNDSPSNGSEFKYADGYISGQEESESKIPEPTEALLKIEVEKEQNIPAMTASFNKRRRVVDSDSESRSDDEDPKGIQSLVIARSTSNKRKRVVESDPEIESDTEDHVPLAQRNFQLTQRSPTNEEEFQDEDGGGTVKKDEPDIECVNRKQEQDIEDSPDLPLSPTSSKEDGPSRCSNGGLDYGGEQEFEDIAEIYGGQNDGLGETEDDYNDELGDSAFCAICDDGGVLLFCDGPCMRSFHASKQAAAESESMCKSLGYLAEEVEEMGSWLCPNCEQSQHQCFICGQLGRSAGKDKEVFVCDVALCGRFYHPHCLADWKTQEKFNGVTDLDAFIQRVKERVEEFCCPAHKCRKCGEGEEERRDGNSMKLAKCRRCPKAYHKLCLPKRISFESRGHEPVRAWEIGDEDDPVKRLLIYCLDHNINEHLSTPERNHLKWPKGSLLRQKRACEDDVNRAKISKLPRGFLSSQKTKLDDGDVFEVIDQLNKPRRPKVSLKQKHLQADVNVGKRNLLINPNMGMDFSLRAGKDRSTISMLKREAVVHDVNAFLPSGKPVNVCKTKELDKKNGNIIPIFKKPSISREGQRHRISQFMQRASQIITLESVIKDLAHPSCYTDIGKRKFMHRGEVISILNAGKKALEKVKNGGSVDDAKLLCPKELFIQLLKNEGMLRVHLAPFLHGMRYTSFGRHFTRVDKLREIVERIHPYIDDGDMVVDFCCGANDFSVLLNKKLLSVGKTCHFKNFDIHPAKNGFCFTKGDWLENQGHGFLEGKKLIMGLNPPFGIQAALANKFILHALSFRPKLLVLIVPPETMSYSNKYKDFNYDLVWVDEELLKGHAFYLPGSVDDNNQENMSQWNKVTPPLYLWSSKETTDKHKEIALRCKHVEFLQAEAPVLPHRQTSTPSPPAREIPGLKVASNSQTNSGSTAREIRRPRVTSNSQTNSGSTAREIRRPRVTSNNQTNSGSTAREIPRLKVTSNNRTNSGSTATECDTSSSHLQYSCAASSQADGNSQNCSNGSRPGQGAARGLNAPVQNSSDTRQASGEPSSSRHAYLQRSYSRTGLGPWSTSHNSFPAARPPHNNISSFPFQHHEAGPRPSNTDVIPTPSGPVGRAPYIEGVPSHWGRADLQSRYHSVHQRPVKDNRGEGPLSQQIVEPRWYRNTMPGQQRPLPSLSHPPLSIHPNMNGIVPQVVPIQDLPLPWQGPHLGFPPPYPPVVPGPRPFGRRPLGSHHAVDKGTGGWLD